MYKNYIKATKEVHWATVTVAVRLGGDQKFGHCGEKRGASLVRMIIKNQCPKIQGELDTFFNLKLTLGRWN